MGKELPRSSGYAAGRCTEYRGYQQLTARRMLETGAAWTLALLLIASSHFVKWTWKYSATPLEFTKSTAKCVLNIEVGDVWLFTAVMSVAHLYWQTERLYKETKNYCDEGNNELFV